MAGSAVGHMVHHLANQRGTGLPMHPFPVPLPPPEGCVFYGPIPVRPAVPLGLRHRASDEHGLGLAEFEQPLLPAFHANPGLLVATERGMG